MKVARAAGRTCPRCGGAGVPMLFGLPTAAARHAGRAGRLVLAGCFVRGDGSDPQWQCRDHSSHRWTDGNPESADWLAAIRHAIDDADAPHS